MQMDYDIILYWLFIPIKKKQIKLIKKYVTKEHYQDEVNELENEVKQKRKIFRILCNRF